MLAHLVWEPSVLVAASVVCLSRVRRWKLREIRAKFHHLYKKSGSESKNMMSDFASKVAKYPQPPPQIDQNGDLYN